MSKKYIPRLIDPVLAKKLDEHPALLVRGPKWVGKTSSCEKLAQSALMLRDPDVLIAARETINVKPSLLLQGAAPRLIDEWEVLPILWDSVISECDKRNGVANQFLLTGSATPLNINDRLHTGTGRVSSLEMSSFTLEEAWQSTNQVSLEKLFKSPKTVEGISNLSIEDYADIVCRGGWPSVVAQNSTSSSIASDYINAICESDIEEVSDTKVNPTRVRSLLRSLARNIAQAPKSKTLIEDVQETGTSISEPTLREYLNALRRMFILQEIPAWAPALRSKTPLRTSKVMHFCDPSLAAAAIGATRAKFLDDLKTFGYFFESLCVHDLIVYARLLNGQVFHYRDKTDLEIDAVVELPDGTWGAFEIKLGGDERIEEAATNLIKMRDRVNESLTGASKFLAVLTAGTYAYTRADGVHVIPLGCLAH